MGDACELAAVRDAMLKTTQKLFFPGQFKKTRQPTTTSYEK
jgi:hypothetical protein